MTLPCLFCHRIPESGKGLHICNYMCVHTTYANFSLGGSLKRAISYPSFLKVTVSQFLLAQAKICLPFAFHSSDGLHCLQFTFVINHISPLITAVSLYMLFLHLSMKQTQPVFLHVIRRLSFYNYYYGLLVTSSV